MYTPEFHSYPTAILPSDLDFVALNNEHGFIMMRHQTHVNSRRDGSIIYGITSPTIHIIDWVVSRSVINE